MICKKRTFTKREKLQAEFQDNSMLKDEIEKKNNNNKIKRLDSTWVSMTNL